MSRKVINTTHFADGYDILSQTPKNYDKNNYFIKELQDKVDAEWEYRPNRIDVEYETDWGKQTYDDLEVVVQSVRSEKGTPISNDCRRLVFRNILEDRFRIGSRFRFSEARMGAGRCKDSKEDQNVWISINTDSVKMTSSMIIERCNGTLGSTYVDAQGVSHYHYEPVIQSQDLSAVSLFYNETAVSPQSQLLVVAQCNDYTGAYFVNQRFIIGYDKVYRIKAINNFYSNSTFKPRDVGLVRLYMEVTETSPYDDFEKRIAYQQTPSVVIDGGQEPEDPAGSYSIKFVAPAEIPVNIGSDPIVFDARVVNDAGEEVAGVVPVFSCELANLPSGVDYRNYLETLENGTTVTLYKKRAYLRGEARLQWVVEEGVSPSGQRIVAEFSVGLR